MIISYCTIISSIIFNILREQQSDNWGHIGGAIGGAAMSWYFGPRLYLAELPGGLGNVIVDKPILRLPPYIESLPAQINKEVARLSRGMKISGYIPDLPDKPWRSKRNNRQQKQQNIDYRMRQQTAPNQSIKPNLEAFE